MAKIGCLKPFRGHGNAFINTVLEDGEIAFDTSTKQIFMGDGSSAIKDMYPALHTLLDVSLEGANIDTLPTLNNYSIVGSRYGGTYIYGTIPPGITQADIRFVTFTRAYGACRGIMKLYTEGTTFQRLYWFNDTWGDWLVESSHAHLGCAYFGKVADLNDLNIGYFTDWDYSTTPANVPSDVGAGSCFMFSGGMSHFQITFNYNSGDVYIRAKYANVWSTWKAL